MTDAIRGSDGLAEQVLNGTHSVIQDTKANLRGISKSGADADGDEVEQPLSHFHSLFYDLFTWKFPKATAFFFFTTISLIFAFRFVNVLRYVFKGAYMLFAGVAALEIAGKPLGAKGVVSSLRPKRYYTLPRESLERLFAQLHELINFFVLEFQRVVFVENLFATLAAFFASFFGYFLIKYIPFWTLLLLGTVTAFTAPLIYINNQELIDEQIKKASDLVNEKLSTGKGLAEKYAGDAAARARATAAELQQKVHGYTNRASSPSASRSGKVDGISSPNFPSAPTNEPTSAKVKAEAPQPILA